MHHLLIASIANRVRVTLTYDGFSRVVEVHAYGNTRENHGVIRVWQVLGGSVRNEPIGWKLLRTDEVRLAGLSSEAALVPRPGYKRGDPAMAEIYAQI